MAPTKANVHLGNMLILSTPIPLVGVRKPLLAMAGLCGFNVRAALSNGNQAIMCHIENLTDAEVLHNWPCCATKAPGAPRGTIKYIESVLRAEKSSRIINCVMSIHRFGGCLICKRDNDMSTNCLSHALRWHEKNPTPCVLKQRPEALLWTSAWCSSKSFGGF